MSSSLWSLVLNLTATAIIAVLVYILSLLYPAMSAELRAAISCLAAIAAVLGWHYVIRRRFNRLGSWATRIRERLLKAWRPRIESAKAAVLRLRGCLRGELEQCRSELKVERDKYASEKAKVDRLTLALTTLSDRVLRLFDRRIERPDELEWDGAMAASQRALKCAAAAVSHHVSKIVYYDPRYPASWMIGAENAEKARDYFAERWFAEKNAEQLAAWVRGVLQSGSAHRSLVVFAQDIVPDTVAEVRNRTCLLRRYLDAGGRVVWRGDIPFAWQGKAGGAVEEWFGADPLGTGPWKALDVCYCNYRFVWSPPKEGGGYVWDADLPWEMTPMGREIGLSFPRDGILIRPVPCADVDITYLLIPQRGFRIVEVDRHGSDGDLALSWKKNYNERYPYGGFMQYVPGNFVWREVNAGFFRFAVSGWPLLFDE